MKFVEDKMLAASQLPKRTIALVLAGGRGTRLHQLTDNRAKPAVYFGGKFRIIDFALQIASIQVYVVSESLPSIVRIP